MTGFGRAHLIKDGIDVLVEIRSVNHRFLECSIKTLRVYNFLEEHIRKLVQENIARGKVEVSLMIQLQKEADVQVMINSDVVNAYLTALRKENEVLNLKDDIELSTLLRLPEIFTIQKIPLDESIVLDIVLPVVEEALNNFVNMRKIEGEKLSNDISSHLDIIESNVSKIEKLSPKTVKNYYEKLYSKIKEILEQNEIEESRIITEAAIFAEKIAVDEETVRLKSHISQFRSLISENIPVGRKLDFLIQEMNREVNTIGSKAQDIEVTRLVVDMKSEIEKIREQIQNVE
ncbi:MAG: YicC family protein [Ruminococcus sp.]|nr:YicC family protein [Ruminococcus sp.]